MQVECFYASNMDAIKQEAGYRAPRTIEQVRADNRTAFYAGLRSILMQAVMVIALVAVLYVFIVVFAIALQDYTGEYAGYNY